MARGTVLIVYKSGAKVEVECDNFGVTKSSQGATLQSVEWTNPSPRPMFVGVDNIAAIFDLGDLPDAVG